MPKNVSIGVVTSDRMSQDPAGGNPSAGKASKIRQDSARKTVCHVHDEVEASHVGDTVEIRECAPEQTKRWELVRSGHEGPPGRYRGHAGRRPEKKSRPFSEIEQDTNKRPGECSGKPPRTARKRQV